MPFGSEQWMYNADSGFYPHEIDQSLRFNDDDTPYLSRTFASIGNRKTWTWSGWFKRGNLGVQQGLLACQISGVADFTIGFVPSNAFYFYSSNGTTTYRVDTASVFRDVSSWYHIFVATDTTQTTETDRVKIWVNGVQQTLIEQNSGYPPQNYEYPGLNTANQHIIGSWGGLGGYWHPDGYMADYYFIDGQALDPTDFGEFKSGVWIPKSYSGSYGTNGFYLDFGNSGSLGADSSGNGNDWTPNNLAATDQVLDSPTNNFATLNPLVTRSGMLSEANLKFVSDNSVAYMGTISSVMPSSGKWYIESNLTSRGSCSNSILGITNLKDDRHLYGSNSKYFGSPADTSVNSTLRVDDSTAVAGDIYRIKLDLDASPITYSLAINNGSFTDYTLTATGDGYGLVFADAQSGGYGITYATNFGQDSSFAGNKTAQGNTDARGIGDFYYAPPAGYLALCTANLPDPAIDPAQDDVPEDYFNTVLWTGNDTERSITGVGFQPDLVWTKYRSAPNAHTLMDSIRGASARLFSNATNAESATNGLISFDADGFTMGDDATSHNMNASGQTVVGWSWKADGSGVTNTDGTITSTVSANQKAGFSIVSYTSSGVETTTVGHGLSQKPDLVIYKNRDAITPWYITFDFIDGSYDYMEFTTAGVLATTAPLPTSTTISTLGWPSGQKAVAYCFHSVEGYSKFGSYTGNGSTDGPFVYTGFRPAFVLYKSTNNAYGWGIVDNRRTYEFNPADGQLYPHSNAAEGNYTYADFLSNGFKLRSTGLGENASGSNILYMAFAEMPFKYSNAR